MESDARRKSVDDIRGGIALLVRGARRFLNASAAAIAPELPPAAHTVMTHISAHNPISPAVLVAATGIDRSVVSRQLAALVRGGYVEARTDPSDGRVLMYSPTTDAEDRFNAIRIADEDKLEAAFGTWTQEELDDFAHLVTKFNRTVQSL